ncbi:ankyrin repeat protein [Fusarium flagelliforme]|uniref:Ankyrin repeat protein n=1 Tax=Fusarium flagelliforme TaxID=2675880 RepID=A0A395MLP6_9HYPO|nr:ankyrin repeat protein [Fusarium flagelliforme]
MGPLGIITTIVSAIRVGGPPWLKAIIGRSRENLSVAEMELMSSTSEETCELWNGSDVVRCQGLAPVTEFICLVPKQGNGDFTKIKFMDLEEARSEGLLHKQGECFTHLSRRDADRSQDPESLQVWNRIQLYWDGMKRSLSRLPVVDEEATTSVPLGNIGPLDPAQSKPVQPSTSSTSASELVILRNTSTKAPNITLNRYHKATQGQLLAVACFGIILQMGVLVYFAFITYYPTLNFKKNGQAIVGYAFPLASGGTVILVLGMLLCAHVVDHSTEEERYEPCEGRKMTMIWLQQKQTISDQVFHSFALFPRRSPQVITTSQRRKRIAKVSDGKEESSVSSGIEARNVGSSLRQRMRPPKRSYTESTSQSEDQLVTSINLCVIATLVCLSGFLIQFIGLRGMHWSASVAQLIAVMIMTILRAYVRRGFTAPINSQELRNGFEFDGLALALGSPGSKSGAGSMPEEKGVDFQLSKDRTWTVLMSDGSSKPRAPDPKTADRGRNTSERGLVMKRGNNNAQETLWTRMYLAQLAGWQGPASKEARSLAKAMEVTLETFCPKLKDSTTNWKWSIPVEICEDGTNPTLHSVDLELSYKGGQWKARVDELDSVLSLWLYSIDKERDESSGTTVSKGMKDDDGWFRNKALRAGGGLVLFGERSHQLARAFQWWMAVDAPKPSVIDEIKMGDWFERWRVIGSKDSDKVDKDPATRIPCPKEFFSTESNDSLEQLYARHIFHAFVSAAAAKMDKPIDDHSELEKMSTFIPGEWDNLRLRGPNLNKLAGAIHDSGLMDLNQAYLTLIPPLHAVKRLGELDCVIEATFAQATHQLKHLKWEAASNLYTSLLELTRDFHPKSYTFTRVVALVDDYIQIIDRLPKDPERSGKDLFPEASHARRSIEPVLGRDRYKSIRDDLEMLRKCQKRSDEPPNADALSEISTFSFTKLHAHAVAHEKEDSMHRRPPHRPLYDPMNDEDDGSAYDLNRVPHELWKHTNTQDILGLTPLHYVAAWRDNKAEDWIDCLLRKGANVNATDIRGRTPLHHAIGNLRTGAFKSLLDRGASIKAASVDGMTALHYASMTHSTYMVETLLSHPRQAADQFFKDRYGRAPIHLAASNGFYNIIGYFSDSIEVKDGQGKTALDLAVLGDHRETIDALAKHGADLNGLAEEATSESALHRAVRSRNTEAIQKLLDLGADVNRRDEAQWTPLHQASFAGDAKVIDCLIGNGADINSKERIGQTPLLLAARYGRLEVVQRLVAEDGIDMNSEDIYQTSPVEEAARSGFLNVAKLLRDRGATIDAQTQELIDNGGTI